MAIIAEIDAPDRAPLAAGLNRRRFRLISEYHELVRFVWIEKIESYEEVTIYLTSDIPWDWTRLRNGVLNVSWDHDTRAEKSVGLVERAEMEDKTIFGIMAFNDGEMGKDAWDRVQEGTLAGISPDIVLNLRFGTISNGQGGLKWVAYPTSGEILDVSLVANPDDANLYITQMQLRGDLIPAGGAPPPEIAGVAFDTADDLLSLKVKMAFATGDMPGAISDRSYRGEKDMTPEEMEAQLAEANAKLAAAEEKNAEMAAQLEAGKNGDDKEREEMRAQMSASQAAAKEAREKAEEIRVEMARQKAIRSAAVAAGRPDLAESAIAENKTADAFANDLLAGKYASVSFQMGLSRPAPKRHFDYGLFCDALVFPNDQASQAKAAFEMKVMTEHEHALSAANPVRVSSPAGVQMHRLPSKREWHEHFVSPEQFQMAQQRAQMAFATGDMTGAISNTAMFDFSVPYPMDYAADRLIGMCYYREGLVDNVRYPVTIGGITPAFVDEGVEGGTAEPTVIEQDLTPHALVREVELTRRSAIQTGGWSMDETFRVAEIDFRHRIIEAILGTADNGAGVVAVAGVPSTSIIAGILNKANVGGGVSAIEQAARGAITQPAGFTWASADAVPAYDELLKLITALSNKRAPYESRAYVLSPAQVQPYSRTPQFTIDESGANENRAAAAGDMILTGMAGSERIGRFPAVETTLLPTASPTILAGVWAAMNVGTWNTPLFWVDAITRSAQVVFHAYHEFDVSPARSDYFQKAVRS